MAPCFLPLALLSYSVTPLSLSVMTYPTFANLMPRDKVLRIRHFEFAFCTEKKDASRERERERKPHAPVSQKNEQAKRNK